MVLPYSTCTQVDGNIPTWGPCIQEQFFIGSPELMAIVLYAMFAIIFYRSRMPVQVIIPAFTILSFVLAYSTNSDMLDIVFFLSLVPVAGAIFFTLARRFIR